MDRSVESDYCQTVCLLRPDDSLTRIQSNITHGGAEVAVKEDDDFFTVTLPLIRQN